MWTARNGPSAAKGPPKAQEQLKDLPPDLVIRILAFLPVPELPKVATLSRRFKVLCYNDGVYEPKLRALGVPLPAGSASMTPGTATPPNAKGRPQKNGSSPAFPPDLVGKKLKNLKGGEHLPSASSYLGAGTIWGAKMRDAMANMESSVLAPYATPNVPKQRPSPKLPSNTNPTGPSPPASPGGTRKSASPSSSTNSLLFDVRMPSRDRFRIIYEDLKPYYMDFRGKPDTSVIFKEFSRMEDIGLTLHKMSLFCAGGFIEDYKTVSYTVQATLEYFESSILGQFEGAYNRKDYAKMKEIANAAYRLNGGASVVQLFITKNPIFFDEKSNPTLVLSRTPSAPRTTYALADQFGEFMQHTLENVKSQAEVIRIVFPFEMEAMASFITAVFEQSISEYLAAVLSEARSVSGGQGAGYLHTLATTVRHTADFLEFIGSLEEFAGEDGHQKIKGAVWNTYKPYYATYLDEEVASLNSIYTKTVDSWNRSKGDSRTEAHSSDQLFDGNIDAYKRNVMTAVKTVLLAPHYLSKQLLLPILKLGTVGQGAQTPTETKEKEVELPPTPEASPTTDTTTTVTTATAVAAERVQEKEKIKKLHLDEGHMTMLLSLEMSLTMIHANRDAVKRSAIITQMLKESDTRPNTEAIYIVLLRNLGDKHISPGFRDAIYRLGRIANSNDRDKMVADSLNQFFELVHVADLILQMVDVYYADDVVPYIDPTDFLSKINSEKKAFERNLDDNVALGMDRAIQVLIEHVDFILGTEQGVADFNPPPGKAFDMKPTKACLKVIDFLGKHTNLLRGVTDKSTIDVFLQEIGIRVFTALVKHFKAIQVSRDGSMQLICDINAYYDWSSTLRNSDTTKMFAVLKEIGNLFMVEGGHDLRELVHDHERYQGRLRPEEILELLQSRTDYKKIQKDIESADCVIM